MINNLIHNPLVLLTGTAIILDTILGLLRAFKEHKFNSSAGINGAIRKAGMIFSIIILSLADYLMCFNMLFFVPKEWLSVINLQKIGLCEFFSLIFVLYECTSILKNMVLCGIPIPHSLRGKIEKILRELTQEIE